MNQMPLTRHSGERWNPEKSMVLLALLDPSFRWDDEVLRSATFSDTLAGGNDKIRLRNAELCEKIKELETLESVLV